MSLIRASLCSSAARAHTRSDVPWCLVDGEVLSNTNMLQQAICNAYTGTPPASCSRGDPAAAIFEVTRSYNIN
jgi:hypothetical protein